MTYNEDNLDPRARMTRLLVASLLGEAGPAETAEVERALAAEPHLLVGLREIPAGDDRLDARQRLGGRRVDRDDARVRVRAADDRAVEHAGEREVGAEVGASGHLVGAVVADRPRTDVRELAGAHAVTFRISAAASSTARIILS